MKDLKHQVKWLLGLWVRKQRPVKWKYLKASLNIWKNTQIQKALEGMAFPKLWYESWIKIKNIIWFTTQIAQFSKCSWREHTVCITVYYILGCNNSPIKLLTESTQALINATAHLPRARGLGVGRSDWCMAAALGSAPLDPVQHLFSHQGMLCWRGTATPLYRPPLPSREDEVWDVGCN